MERNPNEYTGLHETEIEIGPRGHITLLLLGLDHEGRSIPLSPFRVVLNQEQARSLAQNLLDAAAESYEYQHKSRS